MTRKAILSSLNDGTNFGPTLKRIRQSKRVSQERLAEESGLDRSYISLLERGERNPTVVTLFSISRALGISPSTIISEMESKK